MATSSVSPPPTLENLIETLWSSGGEGRQRVHDLLRAIDVVAPEAVERAYSLQIGRRLGLDSARA